MCYNLPSMVFQPREACINIYTKIDKWDNKSAKKYKEEKQNAKRPSNKGKIFFMPKHAHDLIES